ncbi:MAG: response regulator [Xenococcaceae cyanobacterium MO_188.B19]|nr:response regulator [Xenococcaceae cyanobacterium MO_188.B19]
MANILIAEDESRIASFIEKGLRKNGFKTAIATDGEQTLAMIQNQNFDLLLLDLGLPIKDGWTVLKELRSQEYKLPIIIVSANDFSQDSTEVTDYITKPFRFQDLLARVKFILQKQKPKPTSFKGWI